jgi:serralysin
MKTTLQWIVAIALAASAGVASAEFHTYQIEQIYTNASGTAQYIVMHESQGMGAEYFWEGHALTSTSSAAANVYVFPKNLPIGTGMPPCNYIYGCYAAQSSTANTRVLIATQGFANLGLITPDFIVQNNFLSTS